MVINNNEARVNVTWKGQNGDLSRTPSRVTPNDGDDPPVGDGGRARRGHPRHSRQTPRRTSRGSRDRSLLLRIERCAPVQPDPGAAEGAVRRVKAVIVVGVGALGSHVVQLLRNADATIRVIDFDKVEQKNVASQFHGKPGASGKAGVHRAQAGDDVSVCHCGSGHDPAPSRPGQPYRLSWAKQGGSGDRGLPGQRRVPPHRPGLRPHVRRFLACTAALRRPMAASGNGSSGTRPS